MDLRSIRSLPGCMALWLIMAGASTEPVYAQSFFEKLFGFGVQPQTPAPAQRLGSSGAVLQGSTPAGNGENDGSRGRALREPSAPRDDTGISARFQTMCVRTCDGYYWPLHYPVAKRDLTADAALCQSTCGAQSRLYVRPGPETDAEEMKDLDGNSYGSSRTAFMYRKGLINGCACRPMPWSDGERARHEGYALADAEQAIRLAQGAGERAKAAEGPVIASDPAVGDVALNDSRVGPAEAAALAAAQPQPQPVFEAAGAQRSSAKHAQALADKPAKLKRTARMAAPDRVAQAQPKSLASWFGPPKYRYPGD